MVIVVFRVISFGSWVIAFLVGGFGCVFWLVTCGGFGVELSGCVAVDCGVLIAVVLGLGCWCWFGWFLGSIAFFVWFGRYGILGFGLCCGCFRLGLLGWLLVLVWLVFGFSCFLFLAFGGYGFWLYLVWVVWCFTLVCGLGFALDCLLFGILGVVD